MEGELTLCGRGFKSCPRYSDKEDHLFDERLSSIFCSKTVQMLRNVVGLKRVHVSILIRPEGRMPCRTRFDTVGRLYYLNDVMTLS